jgi:3-hydroxybutyryl-CoA dehydrogenase
MIDTICVCGAGTMGSTIAQLMASNDHRTIVYDVDPAMVTRCYDAITQRLQILIDKKKITADQQTRTLAHLQFTSDINDCVADLIIEAIIEKLPAKTALFNQLAEINHAETIFASNTSSLSIASIADAVQHRERIIGLHFFNPATLMKLVEVISTSTTSEVVKNEVIDFISAIGKTVVTCNDSPGFIVNRVARPYYLEALHLTQTFEVSTNTIDQLMKSTGFKMGPFALMDLIGNDINYAVTDSVYRALGKPDRLKPSEQQQQMVQKGQLGIKSGKGFYDYS